MKFTCSSRAYQGTCGTIHQSYETAERHAERFNLQLRRLGAIGFWSAVGTDDESIEWLEKSGPAYQYNA